MNSLDSERIAIQSIEKILNDELKLDEPDIQATLKINNASELPGFEKIVSEVVGSINLLERLGIENNDINERLIDNLYEVIYPIIDVLDIYHISDKKDPELVDLKREVCSMCAAEIIIDIEAQIFPKGTSRSTSSPAR